MTAEIEAVALENKQLIEDINKARTENEYLAKEKEKELEKQVAEIVSTYATIGTNIGDTVAKIIDAIKNTFCHTIRTGEIFSASNYDMRYYNGKLNSILDSHY